MVLSMLGPRCLPACRCYACTISKAWRSFASLRQIFRLPQIGAIQFAIFLLFFFFLDGSGSQRSAQASKPRPRADRRAVGRVLPSHYSLTARFPRCQTGVGCLRLQPMRVTLPTPDTCCRQLHSALPVFRLVHLQSATGFACWPKKKPHPKRKCAKGTCEIESDAAWSKGRAVCSVKCSRTLNLLVAAATNTVW